MVFYIGACLFFFCTILTLTSVREEPLISSTRETPETEGDENEVDGNNFDDDDPEVEIDEGRPLLPLRRNSYRSFTTSTKPKVGSTATMYMNGVYNREGFVEIDAGTGKRIPHDHVEHTSGDVLLKTLEQSHQLAAASMSSSDPATLTFHSTHAFDTELKQKAKLIKMGIAFS